MFTGCNTWLSRRGADSMGKSLGAPLGIKKEIPGKKLSFLYTVQGRRLVVNASPCRSAIVQHRWFFLVQTAL
jgi:hypothetical protein